MTEEVTTESTPPDASETESELKAYRFRRWMFVLCITLLSMVFTFVLAWLKTGSVAEHAVDGFVGIAETIVVTYLAASAVDRSGIMSSMGDRIKNGPIGNILKAGDKDHG